LDKWGSISYSRLECLASHAIYLVLSPLPLMISFNSSILFHQSLHNLYCHNIKRFYTDSIGPGTFFYFEEGKNSEHAPSGRKSSVSKYTLLSLIWVYPFVRSISTTLGLSLSLFEIFWVWISAYNKGMEWLSFFSQANSKPLLL
jgi:hypothetical protein